jgi:two-component system sensor histidine kinase PilS (NtrC family)
LAWNSCRFIDARRIFGHEGARILDQSLSAWQKAQYPLPGKSSRSTRAREIPDVTAAPLPASVSYRGEREPYPSWRALKAVAVNRLLLAVGLAVIYGPSSPVAVSPPDGSFPPPAATAIVYTVLVACVLLGTYVRWPSKEHQVPIAAFIDIVAFTLLMHGCGGVDSGLGLLLAIAVATGAVLMEGRLSLLFASFATLGVMTQQVYAYLYLGASPANFTQAGLLGITFFAVAMLAHVLYRRIQEAERVAARRKVDIADLSKLNDFIIQSMSTGVVVVDGDRNLRVLNAAAKQLLGVAHAEPGGSLNTIAPPLARWLAERVTTHNARENTISGRDTTLEVTLQLLGDYRESGALMFLRDTQDAIREAQEIKLASLGRLTASIAHNVRNPLSAVSHAAQLLSESTAIADEDRQLLDIIRRNADRIDETVESVLQLSRRGQASPESIDFRDWLPNFCADFREVHHLSTDRLCLELSAGRSTVRTDPRHLHQILANLCHNALKHASRPDAPAHIEIRAQGTASTHARVFVEVLDDGPGIDGETAREIFAPFFTTSSSGTGLGLYIARELSETNGIHLEYIPREPQGSCFRLTFPT